jgi:hypothetical protein
MTTARFTAKPLLATNEPKLESNAERKCGWEVEAIDCTMLVREAGRPWTVPCQKPRPGQACRTAMPMKKSPRPASSSRPSRGLRQVPSGSAMSAPATT